MHSPSTACLLAAAPSYMFHRAYNHLDVVSSRHCLFIIVFAVTYNYFALMTGCTIGRAKSKRRKCELFRY